MSEIRITYSGLVSLSFGLTRIITGLFFMIIITRVLVAEEFGTWTLISGLLFYGIILDPIIAYWATRETARKIDSGKTSVLGEGILSMGGIGIYILCVILVSPQTNVDYNVLLFAVILIPLMYLHKVLSSINLGWKPHVVSYSNFFADLAKIPLALLFVYYFEMGVVGVIISFFIGYIINDIALFWYAKEKIKNQIKKEFFQKWLKISWLPLYPRIASLIGRSDVIIFSIITGSVIGLAYYSAALVIAGIVGYASAFSVGIYGKLLGEKKKDYLGHNITLQVYFMILFAGLSIIFAEFGLFALNPIYKIASLVVIILTIRVFFQTFNGLFSQVLTGIEDVDTIKESRFSDYIKSRLFVVPTIQLIQTISYIVILSFVLIFTNDTSTQLELVIWWSILAVCIEIPFTVFLATLIKKSVDVKIQKSRIAKYLITGIIVFGITFIILEQNITYNEKLIEFLPSLVIFVILSAFLYLIITIVIDSKIRNLFYSILNEIKKKK